MVKSNEPIKRKVDQEIQHTMFVLALIRLTSLCEHRRTVRRLSKFTDNILHYRLRVYLKESMPVLKG